jgi:hypothetical protein
MAERKSFALLASVTLFVVVTAFATVTRPQSISTEPETQAVEAPLLNLQCETYCSSTKLRTGNARITWIDPGISIGRALATAPLQLDQQLQATVFKQGFLEDVFASFPTDEATPESASPQEARTLGPGLEGKSLPAFDLRVVAASRPQISGTEAADVMRLSPEQQQSSVILEGLEPGLTYYWRLRYDREGATVESEPVVCEAPVCPADMGEGPQ